MKKVLFFLLFSSLAVAEQREEWVNFYPAPFAYSAEDFVDKKELQDHLKRYEKLLLSVPSPYFWVKITIEVDALEHMPSFTNDLEGFLNSR